MSASIFFVCMPQVYRNATRNAQLYKCFWIIVTQNHLILCIMSHMITFSWNYDFSNHTLEERKLKIFPYTYGEFRIPVWTKCTWTKSSIFSGATGMISIEFVFLLSWTQLQPGRFWTTAQVNEGSICYTLQHLFSACAHCGGSWSRFSSGVLLKNKKRGVTTCFHTSIVCSIYVQVLYYKT